MQQTAKVDATQEETKEASCRVDTHVTSQSSLACMSKACWFAVSACVSAQEMQTVVDRAEVEIDPVP